MGAETTKAIEDLTVSLGYLKHYAYRMQAATDATDAEGVQRDYQFHKGQVAAKYAKLLEVMR